MIKNFHITPINRQNLIDKINRLDPHVNWVCNIIEKKSKRSIDQNSRYWAMITEFGKHLGYEADEMHEICRYKFLRDFALIDGVLYEKLKSTTKLTTSEFTDYMDAVDRWAVSLGFVWQEAA